MVNDRPNRQTMAYKKQCKFGNYEHQFVCHANMHLCASFGFIIMKGAMKLAINLVVWVESQDKSDKITFFEKALYK